MTTAALLALLLAPGCGGGGGAGDGGRPPRDDGGDDADTPPGDAGPDAVRDAAPGDGGPVPVSACELEERFVLVSADTDAYAADLAVRGNEIGITWHQERPRRFFFGQSTLDAPLVTAPVELAEVPVINETSLVAFGDGFVATWRDFGEDADRLHVTRFRAGAMAGDVRLPGATATYAIVAGVTSAGTLVVYWDQPDGVQAELTYVTSDDAEIFSTPGRVGSRAQFTTVISTATAPGGLGLTWVERENTPVVARLMFADVADDGTPGPPRMLVEHGRYIYETATAFGDDRFAQLTTDSRADIIVVPLYVTLLERDGTPVTEGLRLTADYHHEHAGIAHAGGSFAAVTTAFRDTSFGNEQQVLLRQLDAEGATLFEPLQVSNAAVREHDCCIRANGSKIVAIGNGRYLVVWNEHAQRGTEQVFVIRGATIDCLP